MMDIRDLILWIVLAGFFGFVMYLLCGFARMLDERAEKQNKYCKRGDTDE